MYTVHIYLHTFCALVNDGYLTSITVPRRDDKSVVLVQRNSHALSENDSEVDRGEAKNVPPNICK